MKNQNEHIKKLLRPQSVAIVGASPKENSFSSNLVRAVKSLGYAGNISLVNPRYDEIDGEVCYRSLSAIPETPDCVLYAVADQRLVGALEDAAASGIGGGVIFGRAHGDEANGISTQDAIATIGRESGMSICGANCMGFINLIDRIQVAGMPIPQLATASGVSLISHSGSTWSGLVGNRRGIGFDYAISAGQELVTGVGKYVDFLLREPSIRAIACVLETLREPELFLNAVAEADLRDVPVIVLKLGRSEIGKRFAVSHSGAISGATAAYEAVLRKHNVIQVRTLDELLDTVELFASQRRPQTSGLALGTDSGGERQLIVDIATDIGLQFVDLSPSTLNEIEAVLDPGMEAANPLDYWGDGRDVMAPALKAMGQDAAVGMVVMAANMPGGRQFMHQCADAIISASEELTKPVALLGNIATTMAPDGIARVRGAGIPVLMGTDSGLRAVKHFLDYSQRDRQPAQRPEEECEALPNLAHLVSSPKGTVLSSAEGFELLASFGIPSAPFARIDDDDDLDAFVETHGFPLVLKIDDPAIPHKSEIGGVLVNLQTRKAVEAGVAALRSQHPASQIIIQKQASGQELILGMTSDPDFGPMITLGLGGIYTEIFKDVVVLSPPVTANDALKALKSLRSYPILAGARGQVCADIEKVTKSIVAFSNLSVALGDMISEIEINPLLAGPCGALAVDCLAVRKGKPANA